jgi:alpha-L-rhamnosidase
MKAALALLFAGTLAAQIRPPERLRCEYLENPPAIDVLAPRFSWVPRHDGRDQIQSAYRIVVDGEWDSGKVVSRATSQVEYAGRPLRSNREYRWRVRYWDRDGRPSPYSQTATFHTGLLDSSDWKAQWIGGGNEFRKQFRIAEPVARARAFVTAMGNYELYVNGRRVGDDMLDPAWTEFSKRVLYSAYDVRGMLRAGVNTVEARVGIGRAAKRAFLLQLEMDGERVVTDGSWSARPGAVVADSIYDGEVHDARRASEPWGAAKVMDVRPALSAQMIPPIRVMATLPPRSGGPVFDFGELMSGWARVRVSGAAGSRVRLRYAEAVLPDGSIDRASLRDAKAEDTHILQGAGEEVYEPAFTYHGFRYVEATGDAKVLGAEARSIRSAVEARASFHSSSEYLNGLQAAVVRSIASNLMGIPTDNNQRDERLGWLGDAHITAEVASLNFDLAAFYTKFLRDIADAQKDNGGLPNVVPRFEFKGVDNADPAWESAYILLARHMWREYGDRRVLSEHYGGLERLIRKLRRESGDGLLSTGRFGDWIALEETPPNLVANFYFIQDAEAFAEISEALGRAAAATEYRALAAKLKAAYELEYGGLRTQTALALAIDLGLSGREARAEALVDNIAAHDHHLTTGIVGTRYLLSSLTSVGRSDVAYRVVTQTTYPGWGYMLANGATSIWELWRFVPERRMRSQNQPMLATVGTWLFTALAGIRERGPKIIVDPFTPAVLDSVSSTLGGIATSWRRDGGKIVLHVTVPVNATATVRGVGVGSGDHRFEWSAQ